MSVGYKDRLIFYHSLFGVFLPLIAAVFEHIVLFFQQFTIQYVQSSIKQPLNSLVVHQFVFILFLGLFEVVHTFGRPPDGRRKQTVQSQLQSIFDHFGNQTGQKRTGQLQTRVGVDLDQPNIQMGIDHEIQAKYLKIVT